MNEKVFSTFNSDLAAALITLGYGLIRIDKNIPKKTRFVFKEEKGINAAMLGYLKNKIKLPAQKLLDNQKKLKSRIRREK